MSIAAPTPEPSSVVSNAKHLGLVRQPPEQAAQEAIEELQSVTYYSQVSLGRDQEPLTVICQSELARACNLQFDWRQSYIRFSFTLSVFKSE